MDNLQFGVNGMVGNFLVIKLRVSSRVWDEIEIYLYKNNIPRTILADRYKYNGKIYTKFSALVTPSQLSSIKIIVRKVKIDKLNDEIKQLSLNYEL